MKLILSIILNIIFPIYSHAAYIVDTSSTQNENIYLCVDSSNYNTYDNKIECNIIFEKNSQKYLVYSYENQDYNEEFEFLKTFNNSKLRFSIYNLYDVATGVEWDIIFNIEKEEFFITKPFNLYTTDDILLFETVDFVKKKAKIRRGDNGKTYEIKLVRIKLKDFKKNNCTKINIQPAKEFLNNK